MLILEDIFLHSLILQGETPKEASAADTEQPTKSAQDQEIAITSLSPISMENPE